MTQSCFLSGIQFTKEDRHESQTKSEEAVKLYTNVGYCVCVCVCVCVYKYVRYKYVV